MRRCAPHLYPAALVCAVWLLTPSRADAQWSFAMYFGKQHTSNSTVSISQPTLGTSLDFHDVAFDAKPLKWPSYAGGRIGWLNHSRRFGLEVEFLHSKVYSRTSDTVHVTGTLDGAPVDTTMPMDAIVQRFNMTHGHNFLFVNLVARRPLGDWGGPHETALVFRAGAGPTFQGVDGVVRNVSVQRRAEWDGAGAQLAAGMDLRVAGRLSAQVEYKVTWATPSVSIYAGTGRTTAFTQQVIVGASLRLSR